MDTGLRRNWWGQNSIALVFIEVDGAPQRDVLIFDHERFAESLFLKVVANGRFYLCECRNAFRRLKRGMALQNAEVDAWRPDRWDVLADREELLGDGVACPEIVSVEEYSEWLSVMDADAQRARWVECVATVIEKEPDWFYCFDLPRGRGWRYGGSHLE